MSVEKFHREDEQFDDLFRNSLGEMRTEPSAGVWEKLNRQLFRSEILRFNLTNMPKAFWGIIPAAAIITGIILYFGTGETPSTPIQPVAEENVSIVNTDNNVSNVNDVNNVSNVNDVNNVSNVNDVNNVSNVNSVNTANKAINATNAINETNDITETTTTAPRHHSTTATLHGIFPEPITSGTFGLPTIQFATIPVPKAPSQEVFHKPLSRSFDMGLNITPDMVFYNSSSGSFKYNYTFDFGARYSLGRFYIQSGAGLTYSSDIGDYAISYLKNDSVGFYYTINSFTVDPGNMGNPNFETNKVTVYDSVEYLYDYSTKNKYYYIQIPLNFGYRIFNKPSWRVSIEAGLLYAYLISITEPAPTFYIPEGRILYIERRTPQRNKHSLGITGGISVEYQFAKNFFLLIEPTFKYYLQAIEENSSRGDKQPYSIGLRAGIWYRLNFKNKSR